MREPLHLVGHKVAQVSKSLKPEGRSGKRELTFFRHAFERLGRALNSVLAIIAVGRQQTDHFVGAAGGRTGNVARGKIHSRSNAEFMLQRPSPQTLNNKGLACGPARRPSGKPRKNVAQRMPAWPASSGMANAQILQVFQRDRRDSAGFGGNPRMALDGWAAGFKPKQEGGRSGWPDRPPSAVLGQESAKSDRREHCTW